MPSLRKPPSCAGCPLETRGEGFAPADGPSNAWLLLVGEALGKVEALTGRPFMGDAGGMLTRLLSLLGWTRDAVRIHNVISCFPGETIVSAPGLLHAYKRRYTGVLVTVETGAGVLSGTPNHPVLTTTGWTALGNLQAGDHIVRYAGWDEGEARRHPHVENVPAQIAQVFQSASDAGVGRRVVGRVMDFHGDGMDGEVEIVPAHGMLSAHDQPPILQLLLEQLFQGAYPASSTDRTAVVAAARLLDTWRTSPRSLMRRPGQALPPGASFSPHPQTIRLGLRSPWDLQAVQRGPDATVPEMESPLNRLGSLPVEVELCEVLGITLSEFDGHVYNLETTSHTYVANGFIVHNCHPPGDWFDERAPWYHSAMAFCPYLGETLREPHEVVVTMGGTALRRVLGLEHQKKIRVQDFHGAILRDPTDRVWVVPTYHPSFLQRGAHNLIGTVLWDLKRALEARATGRPATTGVLIIDPPIDYFHAWVDQAIAARQHDPGAYPLTSDVETPDKAGGKDEGEITAEDRSFQILRQNVACHPDEGLTVPNVGPYIDELKRLYASPGPIWEWNREYDFQRQVAAGFLREEDSVKVVDLMWLAHVLQSDLPRGLGFWAPLYSDFGPWKHLADSEPAKYGAGDSLQNHRIGFGVYRDLQKLGMFQTAMRHTHTLHTGVLRPAQLLGVKIDRQRLTVFKADLVEKARATLAAIQEAVPEALRPLTPKQGMTRKPLADVLHVKASAFTRKGTVRAGKPVPEIKQELYAKAIVVERLQLKEVLVCASCAAVDVQRRHRCADRASTPNLDLRPATVSRWYWQEPFNPDSPPQVLAYIKSRKHTPGRTKKTGQDSTDRETLKRLTRTGDPFYSAVLDYRAIAKVKGTYVEGTERRLDKDDRLHPQPSFKPSTMRLSYVNPNITNVVADKDSSRNLAAGFRRCVVASPGCKLLEVDFCVAPETRILKSDLTWNRADALAIGDEVIGFDEKVGKGTGRNSHFRAAHVTAIRTIVRPRVRVHTTQGSITVAADHPFVGRWNHGDPTQARRSNRTWIKAKDLRLGCYLSFMVKPWEVEQSQEAGYLQGFFDGEGWVSSVTVGYGQNEGPVLQYVQRLLQRRGFTFRVSNGSSTAQCEIESGLQGALTFLGTVRPQRLLEKGRQVWENRQTWGKKTTVVQVTGLEVLDDGPVVAIETTTGTYISEGFFSHNSAIEAVETGWCARNPFLIRLARLGIHSYLISLRMQDAPDLSASDDLIRAHLKTIKKKAGTLLYDQIKHTVYGMFYGQTPRGLVATWPDLYPSLKLAEEHVEFIFDQLPAVRAFQQAVLDTAATDHQLGGAQPYAFTPGSGPSPRIVGHPFQYRHWFWSIYTYKRLTMAQYLKITAKTTLQGKPSPVIEINGQHFRVAHGPDANRAIAFYPQSIASGVLKEALLRLLVDRDAPNYIGDAYYGQTPLRAPIHDSGLFEIPDAQVDRVAEAVITEMQRPIVQQPNLPEWAAQGFGPYLHIGVAAKIGQDWQDTQERPLPGKRPIEAAVESLLEPMEVEDGDDFDDLRRVV